MGVLIRNGIRYSGSGDGASELVDLDDVDINSPQEGDVLVSDENGVYQNKPKSLYPSAPITTWAEYQQLVDNDEDDPDAEYFIDDVDVAEAYYVETSGQTAITGATSLTFTNSHITPTSDIRILAEPDSCKVSTNPQYKVSAKISSCGTGTATITFPALAENTTFWLLINCPLPTEPDPAYVYNTDETVIGQWIDGKTIYRKVIEFTMPSSGNDYYFNHNISNIAQVVGYEGYTSPNTSDNNNMRSLNFCYYRDSNWNSVITVGSTNCLIQMGSSFRDAYAGKTCYVILKYTKTTD